MQHDAVDQLLMPATYVQHLAREFSDTRALLRGTGLEFAELVAPERYITVGQNLRCVANAFDIAPSPEWYLGWGKRMAEYIHGPLTPALLSAPTLGHGLDAFCHYFDLRIPYMSFRARHLAGRFRIELVPRLEVGSLLPLLIEIPFLILQHYVGQVRALPMTDASIELAYPKPVHARYGHWFECPVIADAGHHALTLPSAWRDVPNLGYDDTLWPAALRKCEALAAARSSGPLLGRVRNELRCAFAPHTGSRSPPTLEDVASRLHVSSRTLIRRLRAAGTTFQDQVDEVRYGRALDLLDGTDMPLNTIAATLGFADTAGFTRAFKRWSGIGPGEHRRSSTA